MNSRIRTIVVEDEPLAREGLLNYISEVDFLHSVKECENAMEASKVLAQEKVDLMFLDVQMPKITGIAFLKTLKNPPMVIMTTAYPNFAVQGYELDVLDYLVKPFPFERFLKAVNKAKDFLEFKRNRSDTQPVSPDYFFIKCDYRHEKILYKDILYIEGLENYVVIHTVNQKFVTLLRMKSLEETLPPQTFMRIHKSYIVNISMIATLDGNEIIVEGRRLPLSRDRKAEVLKRILNK